MMSTALEHGVPIINEILPVDSIDLAQARAGDNNKNKGIEAANAAIESGLLKRDLT